MSDDLKPTAEWALGRPARSMRYLAEPMSRAIWAEQERDEAEARAEAAEQQAARLRAALAWYADEANYDQDEYDHENVPGEMIDSDKECSRCRLRGCREFFEPDRGGRARAALAASQPAPAAEFTAQELDDIISGTLTVPRSVVERAMRQRGGQAEGEG